MQRLDGPYVVMCVATGPTQTIDLAWQYCESNFRARVCSVSQYLNACNFGVSMPAVMWTDAPVGTGTFATMVGCNMSNVSTATASSQRGTLCCLEWPKY